MIKNDPTNYIRRAQFGKLHLPQIVAKPRRSQKRQQKFSAPLKVDSGYIDLRF